MLLKKSPICYQQGLIDTLYDLFCERVRRTPHTQAYRHFDNQQRQWQSRTWLEISAQVTHLSHTLKHQGAAKGDRCAILSANSPDWVCADQAALSLGLVTIPLFTNDRVENMVHVLKHGQARFLIVDQGQQWQTLQPLLQDSHLTCVLLSTSFQVVWSNPTAKNLAAVPAPHGLATIIYTSGTTGLPKGVMLSHRSIMENARACYGVSTITNGDLFLSFLPLSHAFERTVGYYLPMMCGATVAFARSILTLQEDLLNIHPTVIITVPRMFEKVNERFAEKLSQAPLMMQKLVALAEYIGYQHFLWQQQCHPWKLRQLLFPLLDKIVGRKVRNSLGGRLRLAVSGGAPLSTNIAKRYLAFGVPILQGYGLTECGPVVSSNKLTDNQPESVGTALLDTELTLDDTSHELLVRGSGLMQGYWRNEQATATAIDKHGWLHTGDIASIQEQRLYITGRIKDILILSNGEKIPPTDVEQAIAHDSWVDQVMVVGEGKPFLVALIVPRSHASSNKQRWLKRLSKDMHAFPGYEKVKDIIICQTPWTVEQGLLTPTMKLRRQAILQRYESHIEKLYSPEASA